MRILIYDNSINTNSKFIIPERIIESNEIEYNGDLEVKIKAHNGIWYTIEFNSIHDAIDFCKELTIKGFRSISKQSIIGEEVVVK
jgi:hemin uptake protein HemP